MLRLDTLGKSNEEVNKSIQCKRKSRDLTLLNNNENFMLFKALC